MCRRCCIICLILLKAGQEEDTRVHGWRCSQFGALHLLVASRARLAGLEGFAFMHLSRFSSLPGQMSDFWIDKKPLRGNFSIMQSCSRCECYVGSWMLDVASVLFSQGRFSRWCMSVRAGLQQDHLQCIYRALAYEMI